MGRPRKQPRRIMTFNLNEPLAQRIDDLNLSNRSEWANGVFKEVMDDRLAQRQGQRLEEMENARLDAAVDGAEAELENIRNSVYRAALLFQQALDRAGLGEFRVKGRYDIDTHVSGFITELMVGELTDRRSL